MTEEVIEERVEPAPLEIALLYKILKAQRETLDFLKTITAEGIDVPLSEKTVTDVETINLLREYPYRPLRKVSFFNKGPDTVYVRINEDEKEIPVDNRESYVAERPRPTIKFIILRVDSGNTSTTKMIGSY